MYVMGVRAEAANCSQKSGGQPSRVTRNTSFSAVKWTAAVSQRFGMFAGLRARAKFRTTPATQADTKHRCTMAWCEKSVTQSLRRSGALSPAERSCRSLAMLPDALKPVAAPPKASGRTKERMNATK